MVTPRCSLYSIYSLSCGRSGMCRITAQWTWTIFRLGQQEARVQQGLTFMRIYWVNEGNVYWRVILNEMTIVAVACGKKWGSAPTDVATCCWYFLRVCWIGDNDRKTFLICIHGPSRTNIDPSETNAPCVLLNFEPFAVQGRTLLVGSQFAMSVITTLAEGLATML